MGNVQTAASAHEAQWRQAPSGELVDLGRAHRAPLGQLRTQQTPKRFSSRREGILLGLLVLALHGAVIYWVSQKPTPVLPIVPPEIPPMTIEFAQPAPPVVEPPPPVPPPPPPPVVAPPAIVPPILELPPVVVPPNNVTPVAPPVVTLVVVPPALPPDATFTLPPPVPPVPPVLPPVPVVAPPAPPVTPLEAPPPPYVPVLRPRKQDRN